MTGVRRGRIALIGGLVVAIVVVWTIVAQLMLPVLGGAAEASPAASTPGPTPSVASATAVPSMTTAPATMTPSPTRTVEPTPTSAPTDEPTPTREPPGETDARLAYAEFLLRLEAARAEVEDLNATITAAAEAGDRTTVRTAAVDILQFADRERDWLQAHPPAACYADAHEAAGTMLEAYATVAERAIDWADADPGLETLDALADVVTAAGNARDALAGLVEQLEVTTCAG